MDELPPAAAPSWANNVALGFTCGYYGTETAASAFVDNVNAEHHFGHRQQDDDLERCPER